MKILFIACLLGALLSTSVSASNSYLCITDMATGFAFDKNQNQWHSADFKAGRKYIVSKQTDSESAWEVREVGLNFATSFCKDGFTKYGTLSCQGPEIFLMNKNSLRFLSVYIVGYWGSDDKSTHEGENTPSISIGKCSPL